MSQQISVAVDSSATHFPTKYAEIDIIPAAVLASALDDPYAGVLIFDEQFRLLHVTSRAFELLELETSGISPVCSGNGSDVLRLLSSSGLDRISVQVAKERVSMFNPGMPTAPVLLQNQDQSRRMRMRLRSIDGGKDHEVLRVARFESILPEDFPDIQVTEFALRDSLTGLLTRNSFEAAVSSAFALKPDQPLAVLLIDLDRFKAVNDTLGHAAGDAVLRRAAERLEASVRKSDVVARLGGDEFAVLMQPAPSEQEPIEVANRILDLVQRTYLVDGQVVNIGASIGIACSPEHGNDCATLLRSADLALYHSKTSGRARFHFFESFMEERAQARRTNELELRRALALRQLEVFYQPQVDTAQNRLVGFEALIRWRHPVRGLISPAEFLPIAEEIGVIVPIGDWVLRTACREAMNWPDDITVAVNASPLQFETGTFADSVKKALRGTGLPGRRLEIEITEGILLRNDDAILKTLHNLRSMDVRIAMDDFGTGYASLSQLARFPFDKIKIDKSLAGFEGHDRKQRAIVRAIASLGKSLGVCTLAEGVEDAGQIERLKLDGCTSVQGYVFSRPVPANQLSSIIGQFQPPSQAQSSPQEEIREF